MAKAGNRKVDAFDDEVWLRGAYPGPNYCSNGSLWLATPAGGVKKN